MEILRIVVFYLFLNVAFATEIVGVIKKSADTKMYPDTAINGKKIARMSEHRIIMTANRSFRSMELISLMAESSTRISGVLIDDLMIAFNDSVAASRFNP